MNKELKAFVLGLSGLFAIIIDCGLFLFYRFLYLYTFPAYPSSANIKSFDFLQLFLGCAVYAPLLIGIGLIICALRLKYKKIENKEM